MNFNVKDYFKGFLGLFYPEICLACGKALYNNEHILCLACFMDLPRTGFHHIEDNEVARVFWGRTNITRATSFIYFTRDSRYRNILHELKYNGQPQAGIEMGRLFGLELRDTLFHEADMLLPVPLHPAKLRKRGYNQSEMIARGLSISMNLPVETGYVARTTPTATQTKKSRYERWENVRDSFRIIRPEQLKDKHILLIDDVITTGATIEACAMAIIRAVEGVKVSVATLACVKLQ